MKNAARRLYFTLLEILVVLTILSLGAALAGVKIHQIYKEQRFLSDTQQVLSQLAMAQDLMLIMDTDVKVRFEKDPQTKRFAVWLDIEKPLDEAWGRLVERKVVLSTIQSIKFKGKTQNKLALLFSLGKMSKGTLTLSESSSLDFSDNKNPKFLIKLPGYPRSFHSPEKKKEEGNREDVSQILYPKEVYEKLYANPAENQEKV